MIQKVKNRLIKIITQLSYGQILTFESMVKEFNIKENKIKYELSKLSKFFPIIIEKDRCYINFDIGSKVKKLDFDYLLPIIMGNEFDDAYIIELKKIREKFFSYNENRERNNDIYLDIQKFKTYELSHCIAYEMAIRNNNVIKIYLKLDFIKALIDLDPKFLIQKRNIFIKINYKEDDLEFLKTTYDVTVIDGEEKKVKAYKLNKPIDLGVNSSKRNNSIVKTLVLDKNQFEKIQEYLKKHHNKEIVDMPEVSYNKILKQNEIEIEKLKELSKKSYLEFTEYLEDENNNIYAEHIDILKQILENELMDDYLMYPKNYSKEIPNTNGLLVQKTVHLDEEKEIELSENINIYSSDKFILSQGIKTGDNKYFMNNILSNFKRFIHDPDEVLIPLNLSLPLEDLKEYISDIKNTLNPEYGQKKIKAKMDFLNKKVKKAANIINMGITDKNGKEIYFDTSRGETLTAKYADMFFMYDMWKIGLSYDEITKKLRTFWLSEKTIDIKTFRKYLKITEDYIDKARYTELIIGSKTLN